MRKIQRTDERVYIMHTETRRYRDLGPLQELLLTACPADSRGRKSIPALAKELGVSHQYVYRWIEQNRVPPRFVKPIVQLSEGQIRLEQFHPYVF